MSSLVSEVATASSQETVSHFSQKFMFQTDCWDVHESLKSNPDFVLLDVRGPASYAESHVPGAVNLPHGKIVASKLERWDEDTLFVVYCAGPHCNGADRAALRLARLGRPVKLMVGGMTGWADEGFDFAHGEEPGSVVAAA